MTNTQSNSIFKKLISASRTILWGILYLPSLCFLLLYPLRWTSEDSLDAVRMTSYIFPWLLIFFVPLFVISIVGRRKQLAVVTVIPILTIAFTFAPLFLPKVQTTPAPDRSTLKIMSYNMHAIKDIRGIAEVIRQEKPDILLIQEYSNRLFSPSFHGLDNLYPELYMEVASKDFRQATLSRYPIKLISAELDKGRTQKMQIELPTGTIEVWNVHPMPPFLILPEEFDAQMSALAEDIPQVDGPLIVAGDLNATDQSEIYRKFNQYLQDAHWETGWGFGFSYPASPYKFMEMPFQTGPLWRIDYVFHSQHLYAISARTLTASGGSDHLPIVVELSITK